MRLILVGKLVFFQTFNELVIIPFMSPRRGHPYQHA